VLDPWPAKESGDASRPRRDSHTRRHFLSALCDTCSPVGAMGCLARSAHHLNRRFPCRRWTKVDLATNLGQSRLKWPHTVPQSAAAPESSLSGTELGGRCATRHRASRPDLIKRQTYQTGSWSRRRRDALHRAGCPIRATPFLACPAMCSVG